MDGAIQVEVDISSERYLGDTCNNYLIVRFSPPHTELEIQNEVKHNIQRGR